MNRIREAISMAVSDHRTEIRRRMKSSFARGHEVDLLRYVHAAGTIDSIAPCSPSAAPR